jgi:hypothetical protein
VIAGAATVVAGAALAEGAGAVSVGVADGIGMGDAMLADGGALATVTGGSTFASFERVARTPPATAAMTSTPAPMPMSAYGGLFVGRTGSACHELFVDAPGKPGLRIPPLAGVAAIATVPGAPGIARGALPLPVTAPGCGGIGRPGDGVDAKPAGACGPVGVTGEG